MKIVLLAAAALIASPSLAQQNQPTSTPAPASSQGGSPPTAADGSAGAMSSMTPPPAAPAGDPVGGYQPAAPAMSGPMQPGATVTFQAAQSPDQAYPAPAPMAKYPMCKPGQFDKCMQGPGSTHSRQVHAKK